MPTVGTSGTVSRGSISIRPDLCKACGLCLVVCPVHCIEFSASVNRLGYWPAHYTGQGCTACSVCFYVCPEPGAIAVFRTEKEQNMGLTKPIDQHATPTVDREQAEHEL